MINAKKYLHLVEILKTESDLETVEAFLYNRGKIVIDKKALYEEYCSDERDKILEAHKRPKKPITCILGLGIFDEKKDDDEEEIDYSWGRTKSKNK